MADYGCDFVVCVEKWFVGEQVILASNFGGDSE